MHNQLTIVIPTHDRVDLLRRTVASLGRCRVPDAPLRTVIIENGGKFGADDVVREAPDWLCAEYVYRQEGNKSAALNDVLQSIVSGLVVFFDDDIRLCECVLTRYAESAQRQRTRRFFAGPMEVDYETPPPDWLRDYLPGSALGWTWETETLIDKPVAMGCNWAAFAADLKRVGGFDQDRGPGATSDSVGQERAMQELLIADGIHGTFLAEAIVWHYVPLTRCSTKWVLHRKFRIGVSFGMLDTSKGRETFGISHWMLRACFEHYIRAMWNRALGRSDEAFARMVSYYTRCGRIKGRRLALKRQRSALTVNSGKRQSS